MSYSKDTRRSKYWNPYPGVRPSRRRRSRRPVALVVAFMAVAFLGTVWYFGMDTADIGSIILDGIGDAAKYGSVALERVGDVAAGGSAALDDLGDAARETADMVVESQENVPLPGGNAADAPESAPDRTEMPIVESMESVDEPPSVMPGTTTPSPFDRTIWPDETAYDSRQDVQEVEPTPPIQSGLETDTEAVPQPTKAEQIEELVYTMTNQYREAAGLQPLDRITKIDQIARAHSEDMAKRNYFEHDTPEGLDPTDRGNAAGYPCRKDYGSYYSYGLAENIFMHTGTWYGAEHLADEIMKGWMNSFGHRQNIMESDYDRIGIGVAIGGGAVYATQNFC